MSKRQSKISCDISKEAKGMLAGYCLKHERSQGWLIEKMIRQFCVEVKQPTEKAPYRTTKEEMIKPKVKRFVPPTVMDTKEYMFERGGGSDLEAEKFNDFYESNGWKVGKNKMKCWKAAVRNWLKGYKEKSGGKDILAISAASDWHKEEDQGF